MMEVDVSLTRGEFTLMAQLHAVAGVLGIFGPSGSGKTTLLNVIAGLVKPQRGTIRLGTQTLVDVAAGIATPVHRRRFGIVFQHGLLLPHLSVAGNLRYGERLVPVEQRRITWDEVVDALRLGDVLTRSVLDLSGGERQRVACGRALLCSPQALLCDEPLSAVDREHRSEILSVLRTLVDRLGIPMLYVSHDLRELLAIADQVALMDGGRVIAQDTIAALARDPITRGRLYDQEVVAQVTAAAALDPRGSGPTMPPC